MSEQQTPPQQVAPGRFFYSPDEAKRLLDAMQEMAQATEGVAEYGIDDLTRQVGAWTSILLERNQTTEPELLAARAWQLARAFIEERDKFVAELDGEPQE